MNLERKTHWETVFATKGRQEVSWFQEYPDTAVQYVQALQLPKDAAIMDCGGGDSGFIEALLHLGYTNLTVLDIAAHALERLKTRLGDNAASVTFIVSDVLDFLPSTQYDFWYDRACFHFLTKSNQIQTYKKLVATAIKPKGDLLLATFSENGPLKCSGLPIQQYTESDLTTLLEPEFELRFSHTEDHPTPFQTTQNFRYCGFKHV
jgi:2-polyprenyl-3-methyl-5-hydroxy-6-metoxy-1,4-benzoquinol methylase